MEEAESAFSCKICYQSYDDDLKKPFIITPCSHTICLECLKEILLLTRKCPFCQKEIKASVCEMKPNYELIDIIYKLKNTNNVARCSKCKELINSIYFTEKNSNVQFICKICAKYSSNNKENSEDAIATSLDDLITNAENELNSLQSELHHNINKENLKTLVSNIMTEYLKKTICDLLDQKKDLLASFIDSQEFSNTLERYRKSLETVLKSKDDSIKYLQSNSAILKITIKDQIVHNILNIKTLENDEILNQKIKNFTQNIHKEFNKNKLFIHGMLSPITSDIIYQANIALMNIVRECLRDDFLLLDKLASFNMDTYNNSMMSSNISNFQQNHIQGGYLFQQFHLKNKLKNLDLNDDNSEFSLSHMSVNSNVITDSYVASIIGLIVELHPENEKLNLVLEKQFNCQASIIKKNDGYYGVQLYFKNSNLLDNFMKKKFHVFKVDDQMVKLFKKPNKFGNRFYVKYENN